MVVDAPVLRIPRIASVVFVSTLPTSCPPAGWLPAGAYLASRML